MTLADVKSHLRYPQTYTTDDLALNGFIQAANDIIRQECGDVVPTKYDETYDGGDLVVYLRHRPVLSIDNVEEGWGWFNFELDYQQVNTVPAGSVYAYSIDSPESGGLSRRSAGNVNIPFVWGVKNIRIIYTAGRATVPGAIRLAALELIAHWWQGSQLRSTANNAGFQAFDTVEGERYTRAPDEININAGVPYRVLELLKPYRQWDPLESTCRHASLSIL